MGRLDKAIPSAADGSVPIGGRMRQARQIAGITLTEFANHLGYSKAYLSAVETGKWLPNESLLQQYEANLHLEIGTLAPRQEISDATSDAGHEADSEGNVFLSGASSAVDGLTMREATQLSTHIYSRVLKVCKEIGLRCYCSPLLLNPRKEPGPQFTNWAEEQELVNSCKILVAYVSEPAFAVGAHLAMASAVNMPILLLAKRGTPRDVIDLVANNKEYQGTITFDEAEEFEIPLAKRLYRIVSLQNLDEVAQREQQSWTIAEYKARIEWLDELLQDVPSRQTLPIYPISKQQWRDFNVDERVPV